MHGYAPPGMTMRRRPHTIFGMSVRRRSAAADDIRALFPVAASNLTASSAGICPLLSAKFCTRLQAVASASLRSRPGLRDLAERLGVLP